MLKLSIYMLIWIVKTDFFKTVLKDDVATFHKYMEIQANKQEISTLYQTTNPEIPTPRQATNPETSTPQQATNLFI